MGEDYLAALALIMGAIGAPPSFAEGLPSAKPAEVGLSLDRLERLTHAMEQDIETGRRVGTVVAVSRKGKVVYNMAFGVADRETVDMMLMDQLPPDVKGIKFGPKFIKPGERYGLGIGLYTDVAASGLIGSEGVAYWPGFGHTVTFIDRKEDMLILALSQHQPAGHAWEDRVRSLAYRHLSTERGTRRPDRFRRAATVEEEGEGPWFEQSGCCCR